MKKKVTLRYMIEAVRYVDVEDPLEAVRAAASQVNVESAGMLKTPSKAVVADAMTDRLMLVESDGNVVICESGPKS